MNFISRFIDRIKRYRLNSNHIKLVWNAWKGYPFSNGYLNDLEELKLKEMLDYHKKGSLVPITDETRDNIIRWLELAYKLIYIINHENEYYHYDVLTPDEKMFIESDVVVDGRKCYESNPNYKIEYRCDINVNTKNANRFCDTKYIEFLKKYKHELYIAKARHLYHLIRERHDEEWWD